MPLFSTMVSMPKSWFISMLYDDDIPYEVRAHSPPSREHHVDGMMVKQMTWCLNTPEGMMPPPVRRHDLTYQKAWCPARVWGKRCWCSQRDSGNTSHTPAGPRTPPHLKDNQETFSVLIFLVSNRIRWKAALSDLLRITGNWGVSVHGNNSNNNNDNNNAQQQQQQQPQPKRQQDGLFRPPLGRCLKMREILVLPIGKTLALLTVIQHSTHHARHHTGITYLGTAPWHHLLGITWWDTLPCSAHHARHHHPGITYWGTAPCSSCWVSPWHHLLWNSTLLIMHGITLASLTGVQHPAHHARHHPGITYLDTAPYSSCPASPWWRAAGSWWIQPIASLPARETDSWPPGRAALSPVNQQGNRKEQL